MHTPVHTRQTRSGRPLRVAIVEDDRTTRDGLATLIKGTVGYDCVGTYVSVEDALAWAEGPEPDVMLLDIDLPHMDGMSVLREIEIERPGRFQVVLLTAHGGETAQIEGLRSSAVDYLVKPINVPLVIEKVRKLAEDPLHA